VTDATDALAAAKKAVTDQTKAAKVASDKLATTATEAATALAKAKIALKTQTDYDTTIA
jgi:hypothetical protein